ncbi:hypothetical protein [Reyranella sp.]|uniref:hypothetical protein n=1 Tax=Reyranella sp. TaxID=1929291 RepID=UPI0027320288|nr:hypothetical protein [Reyranella sp.]MDP2377585.1 hypothetical protein [Reyranella sp.]
MTTIDAFRNSVSAASPPGGLSTALQALWWVAKDDWKRAHECVQAHEGEADCDLVHAHLHRVEGDLSNAGYWYCHAGRPAATCTLQEEWALVATELLARK